MGYRGGHTATQPSRILKLTGHGGPLASSRARREIVVSSLGLLPKVDRSIGALKGEVINGVLGVALAPHSDPIAAGTIEDDTLIRRRE